MEKKLVPQSPADLVWHKGPPPAPQGQESILVWLASTTPARAVAVEMVAYADGDGGWKWDCEVEGLRAEDAKWWAFLGHWEID